MTATVFTVGHSNHSLDDFCALLQAHGVSALCDVRSHPASRFAPQFNRENLAREIPARGIVYAYLGDSLGGRGAPADYDENGVMDFHRAAAKPAFHRGLARLQTALREGFSPALMCAEKDPIHCHRALLVCRALRRFEIEIAHILADGKIEPHSDTESRLLRLLGGAPLLGEAAADLDAAYDFQARRAAHKRAPVDPAK